MKDEIRQTNTDGIKDLRRMNTNGIIALCLAVGGLILGLIAKAL